LGIRETGDEYMRRVFVFAVPLLFLMMGCTGSQQTAAIKAPASPYAPEARYPLVPDTEVRNIILFIGDGMGINHLTYSRIMTAGVQGWYHIERMPVAAIVRTNCVDLPFTDSGAAATAMATGYKTKRHMIGTTADSMAVQGIVSAAKASGLATGLVSMQDGMTGATPAAFSTHVVNRHNYQEIALQQVEAGADVMLGPGKEWFQMQSQGGKRTDGRDLLLDAAQAGYMVIDGIQNVERAAGPRVLGFISETSRTSEVIIPAVRSAIRLLNGRGRGFFLMVETDDPDNAGHGNDSELAVLPIQRFDRAVAAALEFAVQDGHTLVIVTADHETGGLVLMPGDEKMSVVKPAWTLEEHTAQPVPLFAFGPFASRFSGMLDNTELAWRMGELLHLRAFPAKLPFRSR
jgi:alkaline phosphatase